MCCKCGIFIQSNRNNLDRHEKLHEDNVEKIKCMAKNCRSTFANKYNYYAHWQQKHKTIVIPNMLHKVIEPSKPSKFSNKTNIKHNSVKHTFSDEEPTDFFVLNNLGLIHNIDSKMELPTADSFFGKLE